MLAYIIRRLLLMVPTLIGVVTLTFVVTQFVPGGPVEQVVNQLRHGAHHGEGGSGGGGYHGSQGVSPEQIEQIRKQFGFDKPPLTRYLMMLKSYATFDLGQSYFQHQSVWSVIRSKLPVSITLGLWTVILTYAVSVPLGIAKAVRNGSRFDTVTSVLVLVGYAIPGFVLGVLLLMLFGGGTFWQVFPMRGITSDNFESLSAFGKLLDYLWHIVLPVTAAWWATSRSSPFSRRTRSLKRSGDSTCSRHGRRARPNATCSGSTCCATPPFRCSRACPPRSWAPS